MHKSCTVSAYKFSLNKTSFDSVKSLWIYRAENKGITFLKKSPSYENSRARCEEWHWINFPGW